MTEQQKLERLKKLERMIYLKERIDELEKKQGPSLGDQALAGLDAVGRVLDYAGGVTRTAVIDGLDEAFSDGKLVDSKDYQNALDANPSINTESLLNKIGMDEGFTRSALGFGGDLVTDPLSLIPISKVGKLGKLLTLSKGPSKDIGYKIYRAPFKRLDEANQHLIDQGKFVKSGQGDVIQNGKILRERYLPTEIMFDEGIKGRANTVHRETLALGDKLRRDANEIIEANRNLKVNTNDIAMPILDELDKIKGVQDLSQEQGLYGKALREELKKLVKKDIPQKEQFNVRARGLVSQKTPTTNLDEYIRTGDKNLLKEFNVMDSATSKKGFNKKSQNAYKDNTPYSDAQEKTDQLMARRHNYAAADALNEAEAGLGEKLRFINNKRGTLLSGYKGLKLDIDRINRVNPITQIDGALMGSGLGGNNNAWWALAIKQAAKMLQNPAIMTYGGKGLANQGAKGNLDTALRRLYILNTTENGEQ